MHPADGEDDLRAAFDRELRHLPMPRAPQTLLPRVMASVQEWARRPWYTREWLTWPLGWQIVSVAALALLVAGGAMLLPDVRATATSVSSMVSTPAGILALAQRAALGVHMTVVLGRALLEPVVPYLFAVVLMMCLACAAFGTALSRVVLARR